MIENIFGKRKKEGKSIGVLPTYWAKKLHFYHFVATPWKLFTLLSFLGRENNLLHSNEFGQTEES